MSDYHPETWNPMWSVATLLNGLLAFMLDDSPAIGVCASTAEEKRALAVQSWDFNRRDKVLHELFPQHLAEENRVKLPQLAQAQANHNAGGGSAGADDPGAPGAWHPEAGADLPGRPIPSLQPGQKAKSVDSRAKKNAGCCSSPHR